jgi:hypothetical protein
MDYLEDSQAPSGKNKHPPARWVDARVADDALAKWGSRRPTPSAIGYRLCSGHWVSPRLARGGNFERAERRTRIAFQS